MAQRYPKPSSERRGNKHPGTNGPSRGGIQKRPGGRGGREERGGRGGRGRRGGLYRSDRDGDLEMSTGEGDESGHGRGRSQGGARSDTRYDTPHRAFTKRLEEMMGNQIDRKAGGPLEELTIHGWRQSKVVQDLKQGQAIWKTREWLEKKAGNLNGIKKVCLKIQSAGPKHPTDFALIGPLSFQANLSERRPRYRRMIAAVYA